LSPLLEGQGDHLVAGVAREVDSSGNGLGNKNVSVDGREFKRTLVGALHQELRVPGEDTQRKIGRQRIVAGIVAELRFGRRPFARHRQRRIDSLGRKRSTKLKPGKVYVPSALRFGRNPASNLSG
jgi:hypothetical protein